MAMLRSTIYWEDDYHPSTSLARKKEGIIGTHNLENVAPGELTLFYLIGELRPKFKAEKRQNEKGLVHTVIFT